MTVKNVRSDALIPCGKCGCRKVAVVDCCDFCYKCKAKLVRCSSCMVRLPSLDGCIRSKLCDGCDTAPLWRDPPERPELPGVEDLVDLLDDTNMGNYDA